MARTVRSLADSLLGDEEFAGLSALYAPGKAAADVLLDLLADETVPQAAPLRYKAAGLRKRQAWQQTWQAQRQEDAAGATGPSGREVIPPRFTAADFHRPSYWKQRGKFDVPHERFVSFGATVSALSATTPIGWAGWRDRERVTVLLDLLDADAHAHAQRPESALPLLAALSELLPWTTSGEEPVSQSASDRDGDAWSREYGARLSRLGLSAENVASWRPPAPRRGRPPRNA